MKLAGPLTRFLAYWPSWLQASQTKTGARDGTTGKLIPDRLLAHPVLATRISRLGEGYFPPTESVLKPRRAHSMAFPSCSRISMFHLEMPCCPHLLCSRPPFPSEPSSTNPDCYLNLLTSPNPHLNRRSARCRSVVGFRMSPLAIRIASSSTVEPSGTARRGR